MREITGCKTYVGIGDSAGRYFTFTRTVGDFRVNKDTVYLDVQIFDKDLQVIQDNKTVKIDDPNLDFNESVQKFFESRNIDTYFQADYEITAKDFSETIHIKWNEQSYEIFENPQNSNIYLTKNKSLRELMKEYPDIPYIPSSELYGCFSEKIDAFKFIAKENMEFTYVSPKNKLEENPMTKENENGISVSKDDFNGFWIPHHNAKVMKRGLEENKAPFLPDASGTIKAEPIYNGASGYCLPAGRLIPVQFAKMENGYDSNIVFPRSTIGALENSIKENEKGVFYNFKDEQGEIYVSSLFFPEQTQNPEGIINATKDKIQQMDNLKDVSMVIASSEPKEYLGTYIAACRSGMKLSVDPQLAEEFKGKLMPTLENDIRPHNSRNKEMPTLSNILFDAEKRGAEICRTLAAEKNQKVSQAQEKPEVTKTPKKNNEAEMCF